MCHTSFLQVAAAELWVQCSQKSDPPITSASTPAAAANTALDVLGWAIVRALWKLLSANKRKPSWLCSAFVNTLLPVQLFDFKVGDAHARAALNGTTQNLEGGSKARTDRGCS